MNKEFKSSNSHNSESSFSSENDEKYLLQSVDNTLKVLDCFIKESTISISEITEKTGMGKSTVFRILYTLNRNGYIQKTPGGEYRLGFKVINAGQNFNNRSALISVAHPFLQQICDAFGETVHLVVWNDFTNVIFIDKVISRVSSIRMDSEIGYIAPAYISATGKAMLAFEDMEFVQQFINNVEYHQHTSNSITNSERLLEELSKIQVEGFASNDEESEPGLTAYAVPILSADSAVAAISVAGPTSRLQHKKETLIPFLKNQARLIADAL